MGVPYLMMTSEDEFWRPRKVPKGETSFYFKVIKFQLFDKFTISLDNSYSLNIIQGLSIIWAVLDNNRQ